MQRAQFPNANDCAHGGANEHAERGAVFTDARPHADTYACPYTDTDTGAHPHTDAHAGHNKFGVYG